MRGVLWVRLGRGKIGQRDLHCLGNLITSQDKKVRIDIDLSTYNITAPQEYHLGIRSKCTYLNPEEYLILSLSPKIASHSVTIIPITYY